MPQNKLDPRTGLEQWLFEHKSLAFFFEEEQRQDKLEGNDLQVQGILERFVEIWIKIDVLLFSFSEPNSFFLKIGWKFRWGEARRVGDAARGEVSVN